MSSPDTISLVQTSESAATLTLINESRRNAIGPRTARDIAHAAETVVEWGVTAVCIDARGPAFCAGADLDDLEASAEAVDEVVDTLLSTPVYFLAVVRGHVRGAGLALLSACPRVLAGADASFGLPEMGRGFFPAALIDAQARLIGERRAFELAFSGRVVSASEADAIGLVSRVIDPGGLESEAEAEIRAIGTSAADAVRHGVRTWQERARALLIEFA